MYKDITDAMLARAFPSDFMFQHVPFEPERPKRHLIRKGLSWVLRASGRALTWTGDKVAA